MNYTKLVNDIIRGEDGYWIYWPEDKHGGAYSEYILETILCILYHLNIEVDKDYGINLGQLSRY